jgi:hypothetical protein
MTELDFYESLQGKIDPFEIERLQQLSGMHTEFVSGEKKNREAGLKLKRDAVALLHRTAEALDYYNNTKNQECLPHAIRFFEYARETCYFLGVDASEHLQGLDYNITGE